MSDCFSKCEYFQKSRITVTGSSQWQVSVLVFSELFEEKRYKLLKRLILGEGGLRLLAEKRILVEKNNQRKRNSENHTSQNANGASLSIG